MGKPAIVGVYCLTNAVNGKQYVGSSTNLHKRWRGHLSCLRAGTHPNARLTAAWQKYGETAFIFQVLEECPPDALLAREQHWIDTLDTYGHGYNLRPQAASCLGRRMTPQQRAATSAMMRRIAADPDYQARRVAAMGPKRVTTLQCAACGAAFTVHNIEVRRHRQYCSLACAYSVIHQTYTKEHSALYRQVPTACITCGSTFPEYPHELAAGRGQWCSRACYDAWRKAHHDDLVRTWTAERAAYLRAHYPTEPTAQVAAALGVNINQVNGAARRAGLTKASPAARTPQAPASDGEA